MVKKQMELAKFTDEYLKAYLKKLTDGEETKMELTKFSQWMLDIGEGNTEPTARDDESEPSWIQIPDEYLLRTLGDKVSYIVDSVYSNLAENYMDLTYLKERAILTPTNDIVDTINNHVVSFIPSDEKQNLSCDSIAKTENIHEKQHLYPVEFINSLNGNNFPQHKLSLKKGFPVMLLHNLNQPEGLCNGPRLIVTAIGDTIIEGQIMTGTHAGKNILISRIALTLKNNRWPFVLQ
jgi:ATP-dependent DNA helicase PIF1